MAAGAVVVAADALLVEPGRLAVTRHRLRTAGGGRARVRLVQLSDLHLRGVGARERAVADAVGALRPDLLVLTGDAVDRADALPHLARFLDLLDERLDAGVPRLAILGNWEYWGHVDLAALERTYERRAVRLLRNASLPLRVGDASLLVTALDDLIAGTPDLQRAADGAAPCANHLLLAHCPAQRDALPAAWRTAPAPPPSNGAGAAQPLAAPTPLPGDDGRAGDPAALPAPVAMLAGHTHGGQLAPFGVALWRPPGSGRYVRGWYGDDGTIPMYVSVGLGTSTVPARLGAVPEVAVFDWEVA